MSTIVCGSLEPGIGENNTIKINGRLTKQNYEPGEVIETLTGICKGQTVTGVSGSYTWPNVTVKQDITNTSYVDATGSSITYTPPSQATKVIYSYLYNTLLTALSCRS